MQGQPRRHTDEHPNHFEVVDGIHQLGVDVGRWL